MDSSISPVRALDARLTPVWRVQLATNDVRSNADQKSLAAQSAEQALEETTQQAQASIAPAKLVIRVDADAGRFVNTLLDPHSDEVLRQYPSDAQLAYARAVNAYLRALG